MRYACVALLLLIASAATASAQEEVVVTARAPTVDVSVSLHRLPIQRMETRVTPDQVVARLMTFDRNGDGKVAATELSERMQAIVSRGDTSGDGALDDSEIRAFAARPLDGATRNLQLYGFGDTSGSGSLSTRSHIYNTIEDLRLAPQTSEEAWRIAARFIDRLENTARVRLRTAMAPMLSGGQLDEFELNAFSQGTGGRAIRLTSPDGTSAQMVVPGLEAHILLGRYQLTAEQLKTAAAIVETFKADLKLDDARRSSLVAELTGVLTYEESDNLRAALARRPVVKTSEIAGGVVGGFAGDTVRETLRISR